MNKREKRTLIGYKFKKKAETINDFILHYSCYIM